MAGQRVCTLETLAMSLLEVCFWACAALVAYACVIYPLLLALLARFAARPLRLEGAAPRSVSIVLAVHNEEAVIDRRLTELSSLLAASALEGEVIVVSDGS